LESVSQGTVWIIDDNLSFSESLTKALANNGWMVYGVQSGYRNYPMRQERDAVAIVNANLLGDQAYEILSVQVFGSFTNTNMEEKKLRVNRSGMEFAKEIRMSEHLRFKGGLLILSFEPKDNIKAGHCGDLLKTDGCAYVQIPCDLSKIVDEITKLQQYRLSSTEQLEVIKRLSKDEAIKLLSGFEHSCKNLSGALSTAIEGMNKASVREMKMQIFISLQESVQSNDMSKRVNEFEKISIKILSALSSDFGREFTSIGSLLEPTLKQYKEFVDLLSIPFNRAGIDSIILRGREIVSILHKVEKVTRGIMLSLREEQPNV